VRGVCRYYPAVSLFLFLHAHRLAVSIERPQMLTFLGSIMMSLDFADNNKFQVMWTFKWRTAFIGFVSVETNLGVGLLSPNLYGPSFRIASTCPKSLLMLLQRHSLQLADISFSTKSSTICSISLSITTSTCPSRKSTKVSVR